MAINKHLEKADRLKQKGKLEAALEELLLAHEEEPSNEETTEAVAELCVQLDQTKEGRGYYAILFDRNVEKQNVQRVQEVFAKLQKLGAVEAKRLIALARVLEPQKPKEAAEYYGQAFEAARERQPELALEALEGMARREPASVDLHRRIAELASKLRMNARAAAAYTRVGELLTSRKNFPEAAEALESAYRLSGEGAEARLPLAKACAAAKLYARAIELLEKEPAAAEDPAVLAMLGEAYLAEKQLEKAEAIYWKLAKDSPNALLALTEIAVAYLHEKQAATVLPMLTRLKRELSAAKLQTGLTALAEKISKVEFSEIEVFEFLSHLSDELHLDGPYSKALNGLFDLYFAAGNFGKATEALERLIDVDRYAPECTVKLRKLEGKGDPAAWREMASRLGYGAAGAKASPGAAQLQDIAASEDTAAVGSRETERESGDATAGGEASDNALGDLILQAEICLQYNLQDKARERMERIAKVYPGEEEKNDRLRELYQRANFIPQGIAAPAKPAGTARPAELRTDWGSISELIRNLSRQGTVKGVLTAAVNGIGRMWLSSRCVVGLAAPKQPPSIALEYIASGIQASDAVSLGKLVMGLQQITEESGGALIAEKVSENRALAPMKALLAGLHVESLLGIPLREDEQPAGILILEQCGTARSWRPADVTALETVADQIAFAASNARLRSLMRTLAVTDERSGLLHRESYLTCLLSETERTRLQKASLSAAVVEISGSGRNGALDAFMQQFTNAFASHLRQNDIAVRYGPHQLAMILPSTSGDQAVFIVEKMRKLAASLAGAGVALLMAAGIAEIVRDAAMDGADLVTELINRVESALEEARSAGHNATKVLNPPSLPR